MHTPPDPLHCHPLVTMRLRALSVAVTALTTAIAFGGPNPPPPMTSISKPFAGVDFRGLPAPGPFVTRDGTALAFRRYAPDARADAVTALAPSRPRTLVGFSSGGGFVLRSAGDARQTLFDGFLLLSPFVSRDGPTQRPGSGGWVDVGLPRYVALAVLNRFGLTLLNDLPVTAFAVEAGNPANLTTTYSYALAQNFRPRADYIGDICAVGRPMAVLVGANDEAFRADRFAEVFAAAHPAVPVTVLPGLGHIAITLDPAALQAVVDSLASLYPKGVAS